MFRSIVEAVVRRFALVKKPAPGECSPVAARAATNGNGAPENASVPYHSPVVAEIESPWTPKNVVFPVRNGNEVLESASVPDRGRCVPEHEIRMRAYLNWETAGKPKGHQAGFWLDAKEELLSEEQASHRDLLREASFVKE